MWFGWVESRMRYLIVELERVFLTLPALLDLPSFCVFNFVPVLLYSRQKYIVIQSLIVFIVDLNQGQRLR